jgi:hypothetical protein
MESSSHIKFCIVPVRCGTSIFNQLPRLYVPYVCNTERLLFPGGTTNPLLLSLTHTHSLSLSQHNMQACKCFALACVYLCACVFCAVFSAHRSDAILSKLLTLLVTCSQREMTKVVSGQQTQTRKRPKQNQVCGLERLPSLSPCFELLTMHVVTFHLRNSNT